MGNKKKTVVNKTIHNWHIDWSLAQNGNSKKLKCLWVYEKYFESIVTEVAIP